MDGKVVKRPPKRKEDRIILQFVRLTVSTPVVMRHVPSFCNTKY